MRHRPDGIYHWIGHFMDHWSKMHILFSLARKSAAEVALNLQSKVFAIFGTPRILHSDNGREFVNEIIRAVVKEWPGEVVIINGRPRNPKCQVLIEQGNFMIEKLLGSKFLEYKGSEQPPWTEWLMFIQYQLNTTVHGTMKTTPYELVFGQPPRQNVFPGAKGNSVMEEDVEDLLEDDPDSPVIPSQSCYSNCDEELCTASQPLNEPFNSSTIQTVPPLNASVWETQQSI